MTAIDLDHLRTWVDRSDALDDIVDTRRVAQMAGSLGVAAPPAAGEDLPVPWHWLFFQPVPQPGRTGADGHPTRGEFLPPVPLQRRMWAGSDIRYHRALRVGAGARRQSRVAGIEAKRGRNGELVFVTVAHALYDDAGELAVEETQHIVYRDGTPAAPAAAPVNGDPHQPDVAHQWEDTVVPDAVLLFRYSALTFNAHRIHYDRNYAVHEEGYPGLVAHGPLIASLLFRLACANLGAMDVREFSFRARRPLFDGAPVLLRGARDGDALTLWALTPEQQLAMRVDARLASQS